MTATYDRAGLQFVYPESWTLADDTVDEVPRTVSVQSPTGAFWSVDIHPFSVNAEQLLEDALAVMREEYPELESVKVTEEIDGDSAFGFNLDFYCLDFVVQCRLRALQSGHATYLLTYQAEDRDFDQLENVFKAITFSMFQETSV
ncbi:MAG: hypothetical protein AAF497_13740 [Planctomycetota bacterium]